MKIGFCELPDNLSAAGPEWREFRRRVEREQPDVTVLNEMPFGAWIAGRPEFDAAVAFATIDAHEISLPALAQLPTAVISSRPVFGDDRLANEAFLMSGDAYRALHHKHYFPHEPGHFESTWFGAVRPGFDVAEHRGVRFGVLLCTELMFTEWARHYRRQGAHVIVAPRASGASMRHWDAAARMAAIVSGCYVISSNRVSGHGADGHFGGRGFAYSPTGELLDETSPVRPFAAVNVDLGLVAQAQRTYPCNVRELATQG